jgi:hypothetical protein
MVSHDMTDSLEDPFPDVPFATIGGGIIPALAYLAKIFKNKFKKPVTREISQAPIKAAQKKNSYTFQSGSNFTSPE